MVYSDFRDHIWSLISFFKNNTKNILIQNLACTNIYKNKSDLDQAINLNISESLLPILIISGPVI